ncbi:hypothetical protein PMAYCL1PPCAC_19182, partial [Pristionchus mayeri]
LSEIDPIAACFCDSLLGLSMLIYHPVFLLSLASTIGQGGSRKHSRCFPLFATYIISHTGTLIGVFQLHVLFIYTHRGITIYLSMDSDEDWRNLSKTD